jgi:hypothetical protein
MEIRMNQEQQRLEEARNANTPWKKWGPYLSERQWGTVREDYSENGNAWDYLTHEHSHARAYRWGKTGWLAFRTIANAFVLRWPMER